MKKMTFIWVFAGMMTLLCTGAYGWGVNVTNQHEGNFLVEVPYETWYAAPDSLRFWVSPRKTASEQGPLAASYNRFLIYHQVDQWTRKEIYKSPDFKYHNLSKSLHIKISDTMQVTFEQK